MGALERLATPLDLLITIETTSLALPNLWKEERLSAQERSTEVLDLEGKKVCRRERARRGDERETG